jgi:hypothetical protein
MELFAARKNVSDTSLNPEKEVTPDRSPVAFLNPGTFATQMSEHEGCQS